MTQGFLVEARRQYRKEIIPFLENKLEEMRPFRERIHKLAAQQFADQPDPSPAASTTPMLAPEKATKEIESFRWNGHTISEVDGLLEHARDAEAKNHRDNCIYSVDRAIGLTQGFLTSARKQDRKEIIPFLENKLKEIKSFREKQYLNFVV
jgi:hypothetical protein